MPDEGKPVRVFGLTLDFKVNVVALVAFVLSTSSLVIQGVQILRGAQINMSAGERVNLVRFAPPATPEAPYLIVNARLDYVNTGAVGRDAIISSERLVIEFEDLGIYEYRWLHFEMFVPDDSGGAKEVTSDVAHSFPVSGASSATHQTTFVYLPSSDVRTRGAKAAPVLWRDFLRSVQTKQPIALRFLAEDRRGGTYEASCSVVITAPVLEALDRAQWATALCEAGPPKVEAPRAAAPPQPASTQPTQASPSLK